jgi:hypothetical protein
LRRPTLHGLDELQLQATREDNFRVVITTSGAGDLNRLGHYDVRMLLDIQYIGVDGVDGPFGDGDVSDSLSSSLLSTVDLLLLVPPDSVLRIPR